MDIMTDPVIGNDGHTYERAAITEWLTNHHASPMTRRPMALTDIQPNFALRGAIERWKLANEAMPSPIVPLMPLAEKTFAVTAYKTTWGQTYLDIKTTHAAPMETALIAVLDTSGSMDSMATDSSNTAGGSEGDKFSRLDLVKHAMKTLATLLNAEFTTTQSSLALISFSSAAQLLMPMTKMDDVGLNSATAVINALRTDGATNIWDGLRQALMQAEQVIQRNPAANIQILLLTDGEPTATLLPPLGIKSTLQRKINALKGKVTISTFGFGYSLDADLLESICILGNGTYGFIPDCSMVGTVFINWAAKALLTLAHHITVELNTQKYLMGDIIKGRSQTLILPAQAPDEVKITYDNGQELTVAVTHMEAPPERARNVFYLEKLRVEVEDFKKSKDQTAVITRHLTALKAEIDALLEPTEFQKDISRDIESADDSEGQLLKAASQSVWWRSWGRNHCLAYYHALKLQQCVNFKDKVLQHFASDEFKELQDKGIDIFSSLPAPIPSVRSYGAAGGGFYGSASAYAPNPTVPVSLFAPDMSQYVSQSGPCFTGDCVALMADTRPKRVDQLKKGDELWGGHKVRALLITPVHKTVQMVRFTSGLKITPWHPMKFLTDEWVFPHDVGEQVDMFVDAYYNLVLESGHIVELNGHQVVTLGHGFEDNDVIKHPYFGTQSVIKDLKKHPGWESGLLQMNPVYMVRSSEMGLVIKI
jgi:Mg-chelatase subunit ChlD